MLPKLFPVNAVKIKCDTLVYDTKLEECTIVPSQKS